MKAYRSYMYGPESGWSVLAAVALGDATVATYLFYDVIVVRIEQRRIESL